MRALLKLLGSLYLLSVAALPASAWQWPVQPVLIAGAFGGDAGERFRTGDQLLRTDDAVGAVADGRVIFVQRRDSRPDSLPSGLGDFVVVQHAQYFRSVYAHLADGSIPHGLKKVVEGETIGRAGSSGRVDQPGLSLSIIDVKEQRFVNPVDLLPAAVDRHPPTVQRAYLSDGTNVQLTDGAVATSSRWAVAAEIIDPAEPGLVRAASSDIASAKSEGISPYGIELSLNDKVVSNIRFDFLAFRRGELYLDQKLRWRFADLYLGPHTYNLGLVDLTPGMNTIKIRTYDFAGNQSVFQQQILYGQPVGAGVTPGTSSGKAPAPSSLPDGGATPP